jgi:hypothetical protein
MAAAVGTSVHETRSKANADYAASLHHIKASVVGDGTQTRASPYKVVYSTPVRWNAAGGDSTATVQWSERVRAGDHIMVWVNESGEFTEGPAPVDQAARDGTSIAIMLWSTVVALSAGILRLLRWRLDIRRAASWDRVLDTQADDESRH